MQNKNTNAALNLAFTFGHPVQINETWKLHLTNCVIKIDHKYPSSPRMVIS